MCVIPIGVIFFIAYFKLMPGPGMTVRKKLKEIVNLVEHGGLKPDASGRVVLPIAYRNLTLNGMIYITQNEDGNYVLFPTSSGIPFLPRGMKGNFRGLLYHGVKDSSDPLASIPKVPRAVSVNLHSFDGIPPMDGELHSIVVEKLLEPSWYEVFRDED